MTMFTLHIFLQGVQAPIRMVFSSEERAKQALAQPIGMDGLFALNDDFGVELRIATLPVARVLVNVIEELEANIEIQLLQARANMKLQKRAQSDPTLGNSGSSIIAPRQSGPVIDFPPRGNA